MNLKTAIYEQLKNDPAITEIVGSRIYRTLAPSKSKMPFITFQRITAINKNDIDLMTERFQFDLVGKIESDDELEKIKEAVLKNLNRFKGDLGGNFQIKAVYLEIIADSFNPDTKARRIILDFKFTYFSNL